MKETERQYKKVPTAELLEFINKEIDYKEDKERDKQCDYREELECREPFKDFKRRIDRMSTEISDLTSAVESLVRHRHDEQGDVTTPISQSIARRFM